MSKYDEFRAVELSCEGAALTIRMRSPKNAVPGTNLHQELGELMSRLRGDDDVRVIVLTGYEDGTFLEPGPAAWYADPKAQAGHNDPQRHWRFMLGMTRLHEALTAIEKPVVARVNG